MTKTLFKGHYGRIHPKRVNDTPLDLPENGKIFRMNRNVWGCQEVRCGYQEVPEFESDNSPEGGQ